MNGGTVTEPRLQPAPLGARGRRDASPAPNMRPVESPRVLPEFAAGVAVRFEARERACCGVPVELARAVPRRQAEYLAGRYCARLAIARVTGIDIMGLVPRGELGQPVWPHGLTGSITHSGNFAWAVVARRRDTPGLGIDTERICSRTRAQGLASLVLHPSERDLAAAELGDEGRVTLVFSAKEAVFKCLYPIIGRRFYYEDVELTSVDLTSGHFTVALVSPVLRSIARRRFLEGRFEVTAAAVHTMVWLSREPTGTDYHGHNTSD